MTRFDIGWVGHATVHIDAGGLRLLTDPIVTARVAHLRRRVTPAPALAPHVVLISHVHLDHLHAASLQQVVGRAGASTQLVVPRGAASLVRRVCARDTATVHEVAPGDTIEFAAPDGSPVEVAVTAARHSCRRGPHSRVSAAPVGYVVRAAGRAAYFAGDTDLFPGMRELGPIDVALLPIWGWGPTLGEGHLDPGRAAEATEWIDPRHVLPIHWGTYSPIGPRPGPPTWIDNPLHAFEAALAERGLSDRLHAVRPGGTLDLVAGNPSS
ncbi:MAG TPA: MBL fold metallo-hydrolase [Ilumatobacter sp.]|nr:MBL fold metallo-hydrolase [Ilumatobacter sp.]